MNPAEQIYSVLLTHFGKQYWWPASSTDEVIIGAVLTQNTNWSNVEKAIENLKQKHLCTLTAIISAEEGQVAESIRPAGFYNQKAKYLKNVALFFSQQMKANASPGNYKHTRKKLLDVKGVGQETADSILLYAFNKPVFVVDAYTKRIMGRHIKNFPQTYEDIQKWFYSSLDRDVGLFNEYHALLVRCGKLFCRKKPRCNQCPLNSSKLADIT